MLSEEGMDAWVSGEGTTGSQSCLMEPQTARFISQYAQYCTPAYKYRQLLAKYPVLTSFLTTLQLLQWVHQEVVPLLSEEDVDAWVSGEGTTGLVTICTVAHRGAKPTAQAARAVLASLCGTNRAAMMAVRECAQLGIFLSCFFFDRM